ncbi:MAG: LysM peptidoglycan-binding domain-containing protein [Salinibacter sp.]|uniref:LysM peptidoglycan-binding domain-containing protein n=1 Tax=Salinibacter sp. TaxID=2065818 RepID=UPI0035D4BECC
MRVAALLLGTVLMVGALPHTGHAQAQPDSTYVVRSGDTLYSIAQRFGVSVEALQRWNDLEGPSLQVGQTLRVRPPQQDDAPEPSPPNRPSPSDEPVKPDTGAAEDPPLYGRHEAEAGDSFVNLALRLGTTADTLYALNDGVAAPLSAGRTLRLPKRFAPPTHVVESGETLYDIAGKYGVSVRALRATNDLDTTSITPGQRLRLPGRAAPSVPSPGEWASPDSSGPVAAFPDPYAGRLTASGTPYDPDELVVSHPSLPYGSVVLLSRPDADRHTFARVIDRGPLEDGVLLDVSAAVAEQLSIDPNATPTVALRIVWIEGRPE